MLFRQAKDTHGATWVFTVRAAWRHPQACGCQYDQQVYGGEMGEKEGRNVLSAVVKCRSELARVSRNGWCWEPACYTWPGWCQGLGCSLGPCLGLRCYCSWSLCWCPWPMLPPWPWDIQSLGYHRWPFWCLRAVQLLPGPCLSEWPVLPPGAILTFLPLLSLRALSGSVSL